MKQTMTDEWFEAALRLAVYDADKADLSALPPDEVLNAAHPLPAHLRQEFAKRSAHTKLRWKRIALLAVIVVLLAAVVMLGVGAARREFRLKKAIVTYGDDGTISIRFQPTPESELLAMWKYEASLQAFGILDYRLPSYFYENGWHAEIVEKKELPGENRITAELMQGERHMTFTASHWPDGIPDSFFASRKAAKAEETMELRFVTVRLFDYGTGKTELIYAVDSNTFSLTADCTLETMRDVARSLE